MINQKEIDEAFVATIESILQICEKITTGNVSHNIATIKGKCREMMQFYHEFPASPWHSVADGDLPKKDGRYIVMAQNGYCHTCKYKTDSRYWDTIGYQSDIAYWMKIPKLPE